MIELIEGDITQTVPDYVSEHPELKIALLNLDVDIFEPTVTILENLYPKIVSGGIIILGDYGRFPGETKAVNEFFKNKIERFIISDGTQSYGFVQILDNNEVGYFLDEQFRSKGLGTEAVELLMKFVPRKRYFATINDKNEPSKKLITKLGFKPKATIYEKIIDPD